jgi:hypothetical protein
MSLAAAILATAAATVLPQAGSGAQLAQAQVQVVIVKAAAVRQATGPEPQRDAPVPQITRRTGEVLVEFQ